MFLLFSGIKDMFTQVAMRVVEFSKYEHFHDSKMYSQSSYTSSHMQDYHKQEEQEQQRKQSNPTTPNSNITLQSDEDPKKKGWCCWR